MCRQYLQLLPPLQVLGIVDEVIASLLQRARVDACVLAQTGRVVKANGPA